MWQRGAKHCPLCASGLARTLVEGRERVHCSNCAFVFYENPASVAAAVVLDPRGRVLLVRRAIEPCRGQWALPAGYQEVDESAAQAAAREVREEAGIEIEVGELFDLLFVPADARKPANVAVFLCRPRSLELRAGADAVEAAWFALDELPADLGFDNGPRILERVRVMLLGRSAHAAPGGTPPTDAMTTPTRYSQAGVDIAKKYAAVDSATDAIRKTFTPGVLGDVGAFGGLFDPARVSAGGEILVASADGVGTKLEIARRAGVYDTIGRDIVHHCIDDILVQGARPLFFMDYVAVGKMEPAVVSAIIRGCAHACAENGLALLGGETAEMPGLYKPGDFDLAGFIVGSVKREKLLDGSRVKPGQVLLALESSGLHTNGYSLARKIVFDELGLALDARPKELGGVSVQDALLAVHRSYFKLVWPLLEQDKIAALSHITGGGLVDNVPRVLNGCDALVDRTAWPVPPLFRFLCERGGVSREEAYHVFNMGIGLVLFVDREHERAVTEHLRAQGERVHVIGRTEAARERTPDAPEGRVRWLDA